MPQSTPTGAEILHGPSHSGRRISQLLLTLIPVAAIFLAGCNDSMTSSSPPPPPPGSSDEITLEPVVSGLDQPLFLTAPAGDARLFVVEKTGRIRIVKDGALLQTSFLDLSGDVSTGSEQGLLSMAFHPAYLPTASSTSTTRT